MANLAIMHGKLEGSEARTGLQGVGGMYAKGLMTVVNTVKSNTVVQKGVYTLISRGFTRSE